MKIKETIYHGKVSNIDEIDLTAGRGHKDFGRGFYLAYNKVQAIGIMNKKYRKAIKRGNRNISKNLYAFDTIQSELDKCRVKVFNKPDIEWLVFVLNCRYSDGTPHNYDVVIGPTADDDTSYCINMYLEGVYGDIKTIGAKQTLLNNLEVNNLGTQVFIGTRRGLSILCNKRNINK